MYFGTTGGASLPELGGVNVGVEAAGADVVPDGSVPNAASGFGRRVGAAGVVLPDVGGVNVGVEAGGSDVVPDGSIPNASSGSRGRGGRRVGAAGASLPELGGVNAGVSGAVLPGAGVFVPGVAVGFVLIIVEISLGVVLGDAAGAAAESLPGGAESLAPQAAQKDAPLEVLAPHFGQNAIMCPP